MVPNRGLMVRWARSFNSQSGMVLERRLNSRTGWSAGLNLASTGGFSNPGDKADLASSIAAWAWFAASFMSRPSRKRTTMVVLFCALVERMDSIPGMLASFSSSGFVTARSM